MTTPAIALEKCLSVLLRMIPEALTEHGLEQCTDEEHNAAIEVGAIALYGEDRATWPAVNPIFHAGCRLIPGSDC
jgi:hypothetical protein